MQQDERFELPARAALRPEGLFFELRDIGPERLQEPFLQQTVQRAQSRSAVVQVHRDDLGKVPPTSAPAGLVFHVGRCGSTLVSQLLKQHGRAVVYSEPLALNDVLVPPHPWSRAELVGALRTLGAAFARHARMPYVLKLSSWNTLYCDIVAEAFPATPWVLCVRDPLEVCVSLLERRPGWLRDAGQPSHMLAPVVHPGRDLPPVEEYLARLVAAYCMAIGRLDLGRGTLVPYESLPEAVWTVVAPRFGLTVDGDALARMAQASLAHAKAPSVDAAPFVPDGLRKRAAATPALLDAIDAIARPELERLVARFAAR